MCSKISAYFIVMPSTPLLKPSCFSSKFYWGLNLKICSFVRGENFELLAGSEKVQTLIQSQGRILSQESHYHNRGAAKYQVDICMILLIYYQLDTFILKGKGLQPVNSDS